MLQVILLDIGIEDCLGDGDFNDGEALTFCSIFCLAAYSSFDLVISDLAKAAIGKNRIKIITMIN